MNASEIRNRIRTRYLDDPVCADGDDDNTLFTDAEIYDAIDEAYKAFAIDTRLLRDYRTTSVTTVTVTADDPWVDISDKVLEIKKAKLSSSGAGLSILDWQRLDDGVFNVDDYYNFTSTSNWEQDTGTPIAIVLNLSEGAVRLYPTPTEDDSIEMVVIRLPLNTISEATKDDELDFSSLWKNALVYGALKELYLKQDSDETEGVDTARVRTFAALYEAEVTKASRQRERSQNSTRSNTTRYGGIP